MDLLQEMKDIEKVVSKENMIALVDKEIENTTLYIKLLNDDIKKDSFNESIERLISANIKKIGLEFTKHTLEKDSECMVDVILGNISLGLAKNLVEQTSYKSKLSDLKVDGVPPGGDSCDEYDKQGSCFIEDTKNDLAKAQGNK